MVTLETAEKASKVTCADESSAGEYTGTKTVGGVILTLAGCKRGAEKCSSAGAAPEEIVSEPLEGVLGVEELGTSSAENKIALELRPAGEPGPVVEFVCGSTTVSVRGSVLAPVKTDKMSLTQAFKFERRAGR